MRKFRKQDLREIGRMALEKSADPPPQIRPLRGPGIIGGSRLEVVADDSCERTVAVRTSLARELGFARRPEGSWVTLPNVDEVVVAVPSAEEVDDAEVLAFDAHTLIEAFDVALAAQKKNGPGLFSTAPVFIALDGESSATSGLKGKAKWRLVIPRSALSARRKENASATEGFVDRVKREFAEMNGVDVSKVVIEFKIIA
jgi:hypothetical protein